MGRFNPEKTFLLETDSYYILRDDKLFFGFERYAHTFPDLKLFFKIPSDSYVLVPRAQLLTGLLTISLFCTDPEAFVQLRVEGAGNDTRLDMTTWNLAGVPSTTTLECSRQAHPGYNPTFAIWDLYLNTHAFTKIVMAFDFAGVQFEILEFKAVLVSDVGHNFTAKTLLAASTGEQVAKQRARAAQTTAGSSKARR